MPQTAMSEITLHRHKPEFVTMHAHVREVLWAKVRTLRAVELTTPLAVVVVITFGRISGAVRRLRRFPLGVLVQIATGKEMLQRPSTIHDVWEDMMLLLLRSSERIIILRLTLSIAVNTTTVLLGSMQRVLVVPVGYVATEFSEHNGFVQSHAKIMGPVIHYHEVPGLERPSEGCSEQCR